MSDVRESVRVRAPVDQVFRFVTALDNYSAYIPGYGAELVEGQRDAEGMTFRWHNDVVGVRITTTERVIEKKKDSFIRYEGRTALGIRFRSSIETRGIPLGTELTIGFEYRLPGASAGRLLDEVLVRRIARREVRRSLRRAKVLCEPANRAAVERTYGFWGWSGLYGPLTVLTFLGREDSVRRRCVELLGLGPGSRVLDLCCGTGRNHPYLCGAVGPAGEIIGVDLTAGMLARAAAQARDRGWSNVRLWERDVSTLDLPSKEIDAAICVLGLSCVPDYRQAIGRAVGHLRSGARVVLCDGKRFDGPWSWLNRPVSPLYRRLAAWDPDVDLAGALAAHSSDVRVERWNGGSIYVASGTVGAVR